MVITPLRLSSFQGKNLPAVAILRLGLIVVEPLPALEIQSKYTCIAAHGSIEKFASIRDNAIQVYSISEIGLQLISIDYFMEGYPCLSLDWRGVLHDCRLVDIGGIKRNEKDLV